MLAIKFKRDTATRFLDCLMSGKRIEPDPNGWGVDDLLQLAGACLLLLTVWTRIAVSLFSGSLFLRSKRGCFWRDLSSFGLTNGSTLAYIVAGWMAL
jgi:hypothetical protein